MSEETKGFLLDPEEWDLELVEAAQAVYDGLTIARLIRRKAFPHVTDIAPQSDGAVLEIYDRLQDQLRMPVLVQPPAEEEEEGMPAEQETGCSHKAVTYFPSLKSYVCDFCHARLHELPR